MPGLKQPGLKITQAKHRGYCYSPRIYMRRAVRSLVVGASCEGEDREEEVPAIRDLVLVPSQNAIIS